MTTGRGARTDAWRLVLKTLVLCGGMGTRAYPYTSEVPKPLLEVGGEPVLLHLMRIYACQGFQEFVLAAGYKAESLLAFADALEEPWSVEVVDTGLETKTGERVRRCGERLDSTFFCTYADGLGDVDLHALLAFHEGHRGRATVTTVALPSQYGTLVTDEGGRVTAFKEKPRLPDHQINAGFFAFDRTLLDEWPGEDLERDVLPALGAADELYAYRHEGFWKSMDTYKDAMELTALSELGRAPWVV